MFPERGQGNAGTETAPSKPSHVRGRDRVYAANVIQQHQNCGGAERAPRGRGESQQRGKDQTQTILGVSVTMPLISCINCHKVSAVNLSFPTPNELSTDYRVLVRRKESILREAWSTVPGRGCLEMSESWFVTALRAHQTPCLSATLLLSP